MCESFNCHSVSSDCVYCIQLSVSDDFFVYDVINEYKITKLSNRDIYITRSILPRKRAYLL